MPGSYFASKAVACAFCLVKIIPEIYVIEKQKTTTKILPKKMRQARIHFLIIIMQKTQNIANNTM